MPFDVNDPQKFLIWGAKELKIMILESMTN